jgi:hypothetical protein
MRIHTYVDCGRITTAPNPVINANKHLTPFFYKLWTEVFILQVTYFRGIGPGFEGRQKCQEFRFSSVALRMQMSWTLSPLLNGNFIARMKGTNAEPSLS